MKSGNNTILQAKKEAKIAMSVIIGIAIFLDIADIVGIYGQSSHNRHSGYHVRISLSKDLCIDATVTRT